MRQRVAIAIALLHRPGADHLRRADHRARRLDPGADPGRDARPGARSRHGADLDQPRSRDGVLAREPHPGDVCGPHHRGRADGRGAAQPAPSLHRGPARIAALARRAGPRPCADSGLDAVAAPTCRRAARSGRAAREATDVCHAAAGARASWRARLPLPSSAARRRLARERAGRGATSVSKRFAPRLTLGERIAAALGSAIETRTVHAVDRRLAVDRPGRGRRARRRIRLRQVDARPHHRRHPAADSRDGAHRRRAGHAPAARKRTTRVQMVFQDPFASLDPRMRVGDTIAEGPLAHGLVDRAERGAYVGKLARGGRPRSGLRQPLSASVLRRPAPAHRDRARARHAARRAGLRRAGGLARRVDPGADHQPVPQAAPRARPDHAVHQPRSRRRAARLGPRRHHVSRPHRRDRRRAARLRQPAPSLYARAARQRAEARARRTARSSASSRSAASCPPRCRRRRGCHFHLRCPHVVERCRGEVPPLREIEAARRAACHLAPIG